MIVLSEMDNNKSEMSPGIFVKDITHAIMLETPIRKTTIEVIFVASSKIRGKSLILIAL